MPWFTETYILMYDNLFQNCHPLLLQWNVFWGMPNPIATLCASGNFTSFFELPPDSTSDIQAVSNAVCSVNITAVDNELVDIFNLDEILIEVILI